MRRRNILSSCKDSNSSLFASTSQSATVNSFAEPYARFVCDNKKSNGTVFILLRIWTSWKLFHKDNTMIKFKWKFSVERSGGILYARRQKRQKPSSPKSVTTSYRPPDCASLTALPAKPQWQWHYSVSQQLSSKDTRPFLVQDKLEVEQVFVWAIVQNVG